MKESKKAILKMLAKDGRKSSRFDLLVLNLALQKVDSDRFDFDGEAVYTDDRKRIVYCLSSKDSFSIPDGVEVIGEMAFRRKKTLRQVAIPPSVKSVERDAFYDCDSLEEVSLPASVTAVRDYAFSECDALKSVRFASVPKHLGRHAFSDCGDLHRVVVPEGSSEAFQKALHYDPSDDDYLFIEDVAGSSARPS